eukprot:gnl/MRDRNA2_/MRDRNA2_61458_c0_seq2.p1 gnl/MRDRNA2_/MRDRNA2_61458_c0~~gnl/MRDRNA2_/MRDRNA2_61458_c0_seq2.p1  ORF type:complete len:685 (+),score=139.48 gnl/MRDRNA2_/MRDRNA2_61458_c0_seq2:250-2055(+)
MATPVANTSGVGGACGVDVWSSSQSLNAVQIAVANILGTPKNHVNVRCNAVGGAFGGKLQRSCPVAAAVSLAAVRFRRSVGMQLTLEEDMTMTGGRHNIMAEYSARFKRDGQIEALVVKIWARQGHVPEMVGFAVGEMVHCLMEMYALENVAIEARVCKCNIGTCTVMRCPGSFEATAIMEKILRHGAHQLGLPAYMVRQTNMQSGICRFFFKEKREEQLRTFMKDFDFEGKRQRVEEWNRKHRFVKRGIALSMGKLTLAFANGAATVSIIAGGGADPVDGSVQVAVHGVEMGQGLYTKVAQAASHALGKVGCKGGVPVELIRVMPADTSLVPNPPVTGGSVTTEMSVRAVNECCLTLVKRLSGLTPKFMKQIFSPDGNKSTSEMTWPELIAASTGPALAPVVDLTATSYLVSGISMGRGLMDTIRTTSGENFGHECFGLSISEVKVDSLTGEAVVSDVHLQYDCGKSMNPALDLGQVQGSFMQGAGAMLREGMQYDPEGRPLTINHWLYKAPTAPEVPPVFNVKWWNDEQKGTVHGAKTIAEPPILLSCSVFGALQEAVQASRVEFGLEGYVALDLPVDAQQLALACGAQNAICEFNTKK